VDEVSELLRGLRPFVSQSADGRSQFAELDVCRFVQGGVGSSLDPHTRRRRWSGHTTTTRRRRPVQVTGTGSYGFDLLGEAFQCVERSPLALRGPGGWFTPPSLIPGGCSGDLQLFLEQGYVQAKSPNLGDGLGERRKRFRSDAFHCCARARRFERAMVPRARRPRYRGRKPLITFRERLTLCLGTDLRRASSCVGGPLSPFVNLNGCSLESRPNLVRISPDALSERDGSEHRGWQVTWPPAPKDQLAAPGRDTGDGNSHPGNEHARKEAPS
jgi:hypothetical protein